MEGHDQRLWPEHNLRLDVTFVDSRQVQILSTETSECPVFGDDWFPYHFHFNGEKSFHDVWWYSSCQGSNLKIFSFDLKDRLLQCWISVIPCEAEVSSQDWSLWASRSIWVPRVCSVFETDFCWYQHAKKYIYAENTTRTSFILYITFYILCRFLFFRCKKGEIHVEGAFFRLTFAIDVMGPDGGMLLRSWRKLYDYFHWTSITQFPKKEKFWKTINMIFWKLKIWILIKETKIDKQF